MRTVLLMTILICLCNINTQIQGHTPANEETKAPGDSTSSVLGGLYGTYPVLDRSKLQKFTERMERIDRTLARLDTMRTRKLDSLNVLTEADTIPVRRCFKFLYGLFTYPKLTEREKKGLKLRKKITGEKEAIAKLEEEISKLEEKKGEMEALKKKHEQYLEKRILWGFVTWEVKKKGK